MAPCGQLEDFLAHETYHQRPTRPAERVIHLPLTGLADLQLCLFAVGCGRGLVRSRVERTVPVVVVVLGEQVFASRWGSRVGDRCCGSVGPARRPAALKRASWD
jgi:hypothetical protein